MSKSWEKAKKKQLYEKTNTVNIDTVKHHMYEQF